MANADTPFGLRLVGHAYSGSPFNARVRPYYVLSTYGTAIHVGDPIVKVDDGSNSAAVTRIGGGTFEIGTLPACNLATVTDTGLITGVVVGVLPTHRDSLRYSAASTEDVLWVCDDPYALYEIQADGAITATMIGLNAVGIRTHSGSNITGLSGLELDSGTTTAPSTDASNPFTIIAQVSRPDNQTNLLHNKVYVRINQSTELLGAIGV
jgi:hypothetical protein